MNTYLGIDTSAYTTSAALVDDNLNILRDERIVLPVEKGKRGLRQSEALFLHIKNLPVLFKRIAPYFSEHNVQAVAASAFPRQTEGSYMPVFLAGLSHARVLSSFAGVPLYEVSHQEGHILAGLTDNNELQEHNAFLAVHFSGGTSEILQINRGGKSCFAITLHLAGLDLHAGQLVDRVGVAMGLPFPAGRAMEALAWRAAENTVNGIPSAVTEKGFSFSGAENKALSYIKQGVPDEDIAFAVLRVIANTLEKGLLRAAAKTGIKEVLLVGGVMANKLIRRRLIDRLEHPAAGLKLYFANPRLSTDNAVGVAMLAGIMNKKHVLTNNGVI